MFVRSSVRHKNIRTRGKCSSNVIRNYSYSLIVSLPLFENIVRSDGLNHFCLCNHFVNKNTLRVF